RPPFILPAENENRETVNHFAAKKRATAIAHIQIQAGNAGLNISASPSRVTAGSHVKRWGPALRAVAPAGFVISVLSVFKEITRQKNCNRPFILPSAGSSAGNPSYLIPHPVLMAPGARGASAPCRPPPGTASTRPMGASRLSYTRRQW